MYERYFLYVQGNGIRRIKRYLEGNGIRTVTGKAEWSTSTIDRMLSNEKYIGQVLVQKAIRRIIWQGSRRRAMANAGCIWLRTHMRRSLTGRFLRKYRK